MSFEVRFFRCRSDNIGLLVRNEATGEAMLVDAPEEGPILAEIEASGWMPSAVLVTHHHSDHVAAIPALKARFGVRLRPPSGAATTISTRTPASPSLSSRATKRCVGAPPTRR